VSSTAAPNVPPPPVYQEPRPGPPLYYSRAPPRSRLAQPPPAYQGPDRVPLCITVAPHRGPGGLNPPLRIRAPTGSLFVLWPRPTSVQVGSPPPPPPPPPAPPPPPPSPFSPPPSLPPRGRPAPWFYFVSHSPPPVGPAGSPPHREQGPRPGPPLYYGRAPSLSRWPTPRGRCSLCSLGRNQCAIPIVYVE